MKTKKYNIIIKLTLGIALSIAAIFPHSIGLRQFLRMDLNKKSLHTDYENNSLEENPSSSSTSSSRLKSIFRAHKKTYFRKSYELEFGAIDKNYKIFSINEKLNLISEEKATEAKSRYLDQLDAFEYKKNWGLLRPHEEKSFYYEVSALGDFYSKLVLDYQIENNLKKAENESEEFQAVRNIQKSVENIVSGASEVAVSEEMKIGTRTNIPERQAGVFMNSVVINAAFDANFAAEDGADRYVISVNRVIPLVNINSSILYGAESTRMNASLSRPVYKNISAQVSQTRAFNKGKAGLTETDEVVMLNYGLSF